MTIRVPESIPFLYLAEVDLFRVGTAESPRLDKVRENKDVDLYDRNGVTVIRANGRGIALFTEEEIRRTRFNGWVWKIPHGTPMPSGLGLYSDHANHYMICPIKDMPVNEYKELLSAIASKCERVMKIVVR